MYPLFAVTTSPLYTHFDCAVPTLKTPQVLRAGERYTAESQPVSLHSLVRRSRTIPHQICGTLPEPRHRVMRSDVSCECSR